MPKKIKKKRVTSKKNPERFVLGKHYVAVPKTDSRHGPFTFSVEEFYNDSEGKWIVDGSGELLLIQNLLKKYDIRGPFTKNEAKTVYEDIAFPDLKDMWRMQWEM